MTGTVTVAPSVSHGSQGTCGGGFVRSHGVAVHAYLVGCGLPGRYSVWLLEGSESLSPAPPLCTHSSWGRPPGPHLSERTPLGLEAPRQEAG